MRFGPSDPKGLAEPTVIAGILMGPILICLAGPSLINALLSLGMMLNMD